jgi:hypothetical protein
MVTIPVQCPTATAQKSSRRASKPPARNAISVRMGNARGGSFSSNTKIEAGCLRSAARSWIWR